MAFGNEFMGKKLCCLYLVINNIKLFRVYDIFFWLSGVREYHMSVMRSPGIPFDAKKKPGQGVLKPFPVGTRVNPFYERNKKKCSI